MNFARFKVSLLQFLVIKRNIGLRAEFRAREAAHI